ncbi:HNH endonuclease [Paraflavitalea soli]|uniref:HNH endonuclease n=1 Tax=Paraflavitalea soli TaxID=2315862 RepID=A0A3B7N887_9BACT|nr:HNH endonuclease signature motif containing protein [Paraflavitalea soli]AXY78081.1 HNH endonuclease [Paraflavitalea soli]
MSSHFLSGLNTQQYGQLKDKLFNTQSGKCFICEDIIDLNLHNGSLDIDHVMPLKLGGKDDPMNFALTHSSCNRSKQDSNLEVARVLKRFEKIKEKAEKDNRGPNLQDILATEGGGKFKLNFSMFDGIIRYSLPQLGDNRVYEVPVYTDYLSDDEYFFVQLPIEYIYHDDVINPRSIGDNISKLVKEFYNKNPQLQVSLGWVENQNGDGSEVKVFDGQHKVAAQILLGVRKIPIRIFINPDKNRLTLTNFHAGTTLRQVAFDKSVQRHLGNTLYSQRVKRYQVEHELQEDNLYFSERDLLNYFRGESKEVKRYILDAIRDAITYSPDNKLRQFTELGGRSNKLPVSYSTIEKTFYSFFIHQDVLITPIDHKLEEGENPRELEKDQITELMNIVAEELFIEHFDVELGTYRIENRIQQGENIPINHLRALRMAKEEIMYTWLRYISQIIKNYYIMHGKPIQEDKLFQYKFAEPLWQRIRSFIRNLANLPLWINKEASSTIFGGKQNYGFWQTIFESGKSPANVQVLSKPIDLMQMIVE